jgi:hypothetical protein
MSLLGLGCACCQAKGSELDVAMQVRQEVLLLTQTDNCPMQINLQ